MIFHPLVGGKAVQENSGAFTATGNKTLNIGFQPDAVWITEGGTANDYIGNTLRVWAGCSFHDDSKVLTHMLSVIDSKYHFRAVYLYQEGNGFSVSFVTHDSANPQNTVSNPQKEYSYYAVKYS